MHPDDYAANQITIIMMNRQTRTGLLSLCALLLLAGTGLTGCADGMLSAQDAAPETASSKLRHAHLFGDGAGKVLERFQELMTYTEFVLGVSDPVLDMQRVVERYENLPGVDVKRSYRKVYRGFAIHVDGAQVEAILNLIELDPDIEWIEPDPRVRFNKPRSSDLRGGNRQHLPWGVDHVDADVSSTQAGNETGRVQGVEIYILDSGIKEHDANVVEALNFVPGGGSEAHDDLGHGTHVAGTAAAQDNSHGVVGVAPGANVHNLKVLDSAGQAEFSTVIAAVEYVTEQKAANPQTPMVVNISFGADVGTSTYNALDEAIASSIAQGVVYVIAAGNEGIDAEHVTPAHVAEAITVGAYDQNNQFASFSNYGRLLDLLAPGLDIASSSNETGAKKPPVLMSGTSMAAPHVAGAAALYLSQHPAATPQQVRNALVNAGQTWVTGAPAGTTHTSVYVGGF